ncbi:uncharacterized protein K452DRAFT_329262 [Aplosporella prunicola CBS 121167]|uniref:DUF7924 domain-containing protein n=1 Tax=Aplosporella prunicola CBS 121167 TaxID=1176127 RepID=A0A6A6B031_9PEZI|nr:uncharacterized protein K452DRAFT_329262 [Aplosporella prunicola CBS 121167]KAF2137380.1 hypothetical protein K452DRAFT_329262 [Aplosporella prunicola CBS 121167]
MRFIRKAKAMKPTRHTHLSLANELEEYGSSLYEDREGIGRESQEWCQKLLQSPQGIPNDTVLSDGDRIRHTLGYLQYGNENRIIRTIGQYIVPLEEAQYQAPWSDYLIGKTDQRWSDCIPVVSKRPQPDCSVGFKRQAFTRGQFQALQLQKESPFRVTNNMFFPFLTCEVKSANTAFEDADRQNANNMTVAVAALVELYRRAGRESEIDHEILAFSVSHNHKHVSIYGHYPVIQGQETKFYRKLIVDYSLADPKICDTWTAYRFTKNVYDIWVPEHLKRISSAIDDLLLETCFESELEELASSPNSCIIPISRSSSEDVSG